MLARILFAVLAATTGLGEGTGCEPYLTMGTGEEPTFYLTTRLDMYEESNGLPGLQRGCSGDPPVVPDLLVV